MGSITFTNFTWSLNFAPEVTNFTSSDPISAQYFGGQGILFEPYFTEKFQNTDYDALLNNYNDNRQNTFLMEVDYSTNIMRPINLESIIERTARKAQVPDSNYTSRRITHPRYEGSRLTSANYNFYTPPGEIQPENNITTSTSSLSTFLNGDTGSWGGDISYGKVAAIDKYPIYMAHFQSSEENYNLWGTYQYDIDQLIFVPTNDIRKEKGYEPVTLKVDGNTNVTNLYETINTFEKGRKVAVSYDSNIQNGINYGSLTKGKFDIAESGIEYITIFSNQYSDMNTGFTSSYETYQDIVTTKKQTSTDGPLMVTGSGYFKLSGSNATLDFTKNPNPLGTGFMSLYGPYLSVFHTYNQSLTNHIFYTPVTYDPLQAQICGATSTTYPGDKNNYIKWVASSSNMPQYEDFKEPFIIRRGDEIRISYLATGSFPSPTTIITTDFTVMKSDLRQIEISSVDPDNVYAYLSENVGHSPGTTILSDIADRIYVSPDPSTLLNPIPKGEIFSFTIRRRTQTDDRIILTVPSPSGSQGALTKSGGGYLIPNDFSPIQKQNTLNIINQLKAKNAG